MNKNDIYIVSAVRTPIGSFLGSLSGLKAPELGSIVIKTAVERAGIKPVDVDEVYMGNVLPANTGQAPARQAAIYAGIPDSVPCTTVNKVCASGMKTVIIGCQTIKSGDNEIVVAGGMESMSNVPFYIEKHRKGNKLGHGKIVDGMIKDGLWDVYNDFHMGNAAELCASEMKISREEQDEYSVRSYKKSESSTQNGLFKEEIVPVEIPQRRGEPVVVDKDEEYTRTNFDKIPVLRPVFLKDGTVTAANASTINDGASAIVLMSGEKLEELELTPLARIVAYADAAQAPEWFTTTPVKAIEKALKKAGLDINDINFFEINEAFAVVVIAAMRELNIDQDKVNVNGGGVSLGHPIGASGNRILVTLANVLKQQNAKYGLATLCNGGGGASAVIIENIL